jgi:hypothetical protein
MTWPLVFNRPPDHDRDVRRWRIQLFAGLAWLVASIPSTLAATADDKWVIGPVLLTRAVVTIAGAWADRRESKRPGSVRDREA